MPEIEILVMRYVKAKVTFGGNIAALVLSGELHA